MGIVSESGQEVFHLFDAAMRLWAESNLPAVAGWLDPSVAGVSAEAFVPQPTSLKAPVVHADLVTTAGPTRLMHVEYETQPDKGLAERLYDYRGRIQRLFPGVRLSQHVIVLGNGVVRGHDDLQANGFALQVQVVYLRDLDPADLLKDPMMAPLAVLGRGSRTQRQATYGAALRLIRDGGHPLAAQLRQAAEALARIRLDPATIERIGKENGMNLQPLVDMYRDTEIGQYVKNLGLEEGREQGLERGREQGLEQGLEQGRERVLLALLRVRFGDRPEAVTAARLLATWPETASIEAITRAADVNSLLSAVPPPQ